MQRANDARLVVGLSSGTSMDGIDAALVAIEPGPDGRLELVAFRTVPYSSELAAQLRSCHEPAGPARLALLNVAVGEAFAVAAGELLADAGVSVGEVRCIGSHGQTLVHVPDSRELAGAPVRATLQIGEPAVIAERTGLTTVADFRSRDMAAGGQGAPLVPLLDHRLYAHPELGRVALNLGGIANLTGLPAAGRLDDVRAFDTGPGNVLLDAAARRSGSAAGFDVDGELAAAGTVDAALLGECLAHPFFGRPPPKSADTADFLGDYSEALWDGASHLAAEDLFATLTELTARSVAEAVSRFVSPRQQVDEVIVSGGGAHNRALMKALGANLGDPLLRPAGEVAAIPGDAKEAVAFALLASETLAGRPGSVVGATGASGPRVLGTIVPGRRGTR